MSKKPDIERLLTLQRLLLQFSQVDRVLHRRHGNNFQRENDTEHSYNLAMTAWFLAPHFPHLNRDTLIRLSLAHDLVEVHAGDTYIYGSAKHVASKAAREEAAAATLRADWPDFADIHDAIAEYAAHASAEACFVYALDKIMPILQIYINEGYSWQKLGVTAKMLHDAKKDKVALSPEIQPYYDELYALLLNHPDKIRPC